MTEEVPDDGRLYITTDAQQLIRAIKNASFLIFVGMIARGISLAQATLFPSALGF